MKKTFSKFSELVKYCEDNNYNGDVYRGNDRQSLFVIDMYDFEQGYKTIEVEEPKTDRERVADMLTKNEFVKEKDFKKVYLTTDFYVGTDGFLYNKGWGKWRYCFTEFLEAFAPSTREEWEKSLYGE